jgi:Flp pilus assembly protein TadG
MQKATTPKRSVFASFLQDRRANIAVTFALAIIPVVSAVGAAVDYSRANSARASLQAACDAAALMLSKTAATMTTAHIQAAATSYVTAKFNRAEAINLRVTPTYTTTGGSQLTLSATAQMPADFIGIMGFNNLDIGAYSEVRWGNTRLRVALVLDNTGSMASSSKLTALKTATNNLLTQLKSAAASNGDVYVSIIPFAKDVNVGSLNYSANWIDWSEWDASNGSCSRSGYSPQSSCISHGGVWTPTNHNTWNGCVEDRGNTTGPSSSNYDTNVSPPSSGITASLFPAEQYAYCTQSIMPLSYNWTAMTSLVNGMSPNGNTNQVIGLAHGWMSLVGGGPYPSPPAMDPNYQYKKVIILLTDGLNTENRWYTNQSSIDARQAITCSNIKAAGITLYTVQVNTSGDPTSALLQSCATDSSKFFLLTSSTQIVTTFNQIGTELSNIRVSK